MDKQPFLKWLLLTALFAVGAVILLKTGIAWSIWDVDSSYLSAVTVAFYCVFSALCGCATWRSCNGDLAWMDEMSRKEAIRDLRQEEEAGWFAAELCFVLGMIGTIVGFIMMLSGFNTLDISNPSTIQGLLTDLGNSMGTALYTTVVGLVCGSLLKVQYFNLAGVLRKAEQETE